MNKYRVLIIDDERLIREGLKSYIDWSALNAEVVAICADGREGVQAIETHHPHIVLTDVSMPNMDGIALLKYVREIHPDQFLFRISLCTGGPEAGRIRLYPQAH